MRQVLWLLTIATLLGLWVLISPLLSDGLPDLLTGELFNQGYWDYPRSSFHALAMIFGSVAVSVIAMGLAAPIGIAAAIYLSECSRGKWRGIQKLTIELLAGVPSVVFGLMGVAFLLPLMTPLTDAFGSLTSTTLVTAGVLLSFMILPTIVTFTDDALRCVPLAVRQEGLGLGLTKAQVIWSVVLPMARRGIGGALTLALGRAVGETIAIYLVIGRTDQDFRWQDLSLVQVFASGQTLTTKLSGSELAIAYGDASHWQALMALGLVLWLGVVSFSVWGSWLSGRKQVL